MVDTAIFSIFHRAPPPPALPEPAPEPVKAAAAPMEPTPPTPEPGPPPQPEAPHEPALEAPTPAPEPSVLQELHALEPRHEPEPTAPPEPHSVEPPPEPEPSAPPFEEPPHEPAPIVQRDSHIAEPLPEPEPPHEPPILEPAPKPEPGIPHELHDTAPIPEPEPVAPPVPAVVEPPDEPAPSVPHDFHVAEPAQEPEPAFVEPMHEPEPPALHEHHVAEHEPEFMAPPEPEPTPPVEYHLAPSGRGHAELETELAFEPDAPPPPYEEDHYSLPEPQVEAWHEPLPHPAEPMPDVVEPAWHGPAELAGIPVGADQLGLANPIVITLLARLKDSSPIELDASQSGIYRPASFRAAPWSGFAYDQAGDGRTGLAAGTRILTSRGEMEVEKLLPGDTALTLRAPALLPIAWIGKSSATAAPILIEAGALGPNLPRRTLCLAPDQPVYVEPVPVPAARLVNGTTIRMLDTVEVDLFHVDVGKSEILFAEGVALSSSDRVRVQTA